ncbi:MAG: transcriptional regulator, LysR family [Firmicutes bacterium]|nr:transcriptional regulator, LysR family [Bacillota bacterium]
MDLRKLEYYEAVSRLKNFTKAAEELHIAQPSVTASIAKLEEELGVVLLHRNRHSVSLTAEGEIFLQKARKILHEVKNVVNEFQDMGSKAKKNLNLAIPTSLGSWMFPIIFSEYTRQYPEVILKVRELGVQNIIDKITDETVELGFIALFEPHPSYEVLPFAYGRLLVLFPNGHPLSKFETIPFNFLKEERFILCSGGSYIRKKIMEECQKCGFVPNILFTPLQVATAFNMVASGAGISFVLDDDIAVIKDNPHLVMRPLAEAIEFATGFIWSKHNYLSVTARNFIQFMQGAKHHIP